CRSDQQRRNRPFVDHVDEYDADDAADRERPQGIGHSAEPALRAAMMLSERSETLRACCHPRSFYTTGSGGPPDSLPLSQVCAPFMAPTTAMCESTTRLRSASSGSSDQTPRCEVPPRMIPSLRAIM